MQPLENPKKSSASHGVDDNIQIPLMKGYLFKKSRYLKAWRKRMTVLTRNKNHICNLSTYNNDQLTETIIIDSNIVLSYKQHTRNTFKLYNKSTKTEFVFRNKEIYNHGCIDWVKCIERAILIPDINCIKLPNQNGYIIKNITTKHIILCYEMMHLQSNRNNIIPHEIFQLINAYSDDCFATDYVANYNIYILHRSNNELSINAGNNIHKMKVLNVDNFGIPHRNKCGYYFSRNEDIPITFDQSTHSLDRLHGIFRIGGISKECDLIMTAFKNQSYDTYYYQLPSIPVQMKKPSVLYHNKHIFTVYDGNIFALDMNVEKEEMQWIQIDNKQTKLIGTTLSFIGCVGGNRLIIIGGWTMNVINERNKYKFKCNYENYGVELFQFEGNKYTEMDNNNNNNKTMCLSSTNSHHGYGGCCCGNGYDFDKLFVGSQHCVELYDAIKDKWMFQNKTSIVHSYYPQLWIDENNGNVLWMASQNGAEWKDVRTSNQWNAIQTKFIHNTCPSVIVCPKY